MIQEHATPVTRTQFHEAVRYTIAQIYGQAALERWLRNPELYTYGVRQMILLGKKLGILVSDYELPPHTPLAGGT